MDGYVNREQVGVKTSVNASLLSKWLNILFWLIIVSMIAFGGRQIIDIVAAAAYGMILLKIASESTHYRSSAICCFIIAVISIIRIPISDRADAVLGVLMSVLPVVVYMIGNYYEFLGHAEVLSDIDQEFSEKWNRLWKWFTGILFVVIAGIVLTELILVIGQVISLASVLGILIVSVVKIVYIFKMAEVFRNYPLQQR